MADTGNEVRPADGEVRRYRKRPVEVEAMRYDGPAWVPEQERYRTPAFGQLAQFTRGRAGTVLVGSVTHGGPNQYGPVIRTLEGPMRVSPGDYIIKGVQGEFYPCKPDIFEATYEPVETPHNGRSRSDNAYRADQFGSQREVTDG
jgi:hypothetical protein